MIVPLATSAARTVVSCAAGPCAPTLGAAGVVVASADATEIVPSESAAASAATATLFFFIFTPSERDPHLATFGTT